MVESDNVRAHHHDGSSLSIILTYGKRHVYSQRAGCRFWSIQVTNGQPECYQKDDEPRIQLNGSSIMVYIYIVQPRHAASRRRCQVSLRWKRVEPSSVLTTSLIPNQWDGFKSNHFTNHRRMNRHYEYNLRYRLTSLKNPKI